MSARALKLNALIERTPGLVVAIFGFVAALATWRVLGTIALHVPIDPNEGWNAYLAQAAISGRTLYPSGDFVNNYPPLSFYLVAALGQLTGDAIIAGRILSLCSFFAIAYALYRAARLMECGRIASALGALFFAASLLVGSDYVGMNDPELMGHALQMAALVLLLKSQDNAIGPALLLVLALFVKHNLIAMPLALALSLALYQRERAMRFAVSGLAFALIGLLAFHLAYGGSLLTHLASARSYSLGLLLTNAQNWLAWSGLPMLILAVLLVVRNDDRFIIFCGLYASIASIVGIVFSGGAGVDVNVFFDADIALALLIALALGRGATSALWRSAIAVGLLLPLAVGIGAVYDADWRNPEFWLRPLAEETMLAQADIAFLHDHQGPAFCETLALCYWARKPPEIDVFNIGEAIAIGGRSDASIIRRLRSHAYGAVEVDTLKPFALGRRVYAALLGAYRIDHANDEGVFFVPR